MIVQGDAWAEVQKLKNNSVNCIITSPPYWGLRDYKGGSREIGSEEDPFLSASS